MIDTGLEVISCGANVPFADQEIFFGPIMEDTDKKVSLIFFKNSVYVCPWEWG